MRLGQNETEGYRDETEVQAERDAITWTNHLKDARECGWGIGHEIGFELGFQKGEIMGRIYVCQRLLQQPLTPRDELKQRSNEELLRLAEELEGQLPSERNGTK